MLAHKSLKHICVATMALWCAFLALSLGAKASGDWGCSISMKVFPAQWNICNNTAVLAPGNDSRVNLTLLIQDLHGRQADAVQGPQGDDYGPWPQKDWARPMRLTYFSDAFGGGDSALAGDHAAMAGEGTICFSEERGAETFIAAVTADADVPESERVALIAARQSLKCGTPESQKGQVPASLLVSASSNPGKEFAAYLVAAAKFYLSDHTDGAGFAALLQSSQPWVKDAATYMVARVQLLAAAENSFNDYGSLDTHKNNAAQSLQAVQLLEAYVAAYPKGDYAASAKGLMRRAYWLSGNSDLQVKSYGAAIADAGSASARLAEEIDTKLALQAYAAPDGNVQLLATQLLTRLRPQRIDEDTKQFDATSPKPLTSTELEAFKPRFPQAPDLYDYLMAAQAYFVGHDAKAVLTLLPDTKPQPNLTSLELSRQLLRAQALSEINLKAAMATAKLAIENAANDFQRGAAELAYASFAERAGKLEAVFEAGSPISSPVLRVVLMERVGGPGLLRRQIVNAAVSESERKIALYTLLYRDLTQEAYAAFVDDVKLLPANLKPNENDWERLGENASLLDFNWTGREEGFHCPALVDLARQLSKSPKDIHARLCLADFLRVKMPEDFELNQKVPEDELGGGKRLFSGKVLLRHDIYVDAINNPNTSHDDRAFALLRAIYCYESVGNNHCGGDAVDKPMRKEWFLRLKSEFGDTSWARAAKYYY